MPIIQQLDSDTINKIAAGEVIERPAAVVKELVENAIDAKSNSITVEIKEGGISFIRITDNGHGIENDDIELAFTRHSTSKIRTAQDLITVTSLGFRGEALSSIASIAQVELITKTPNSLLGTRYVIEGGQEKAFEEIGCPEGTTFIIRNLFYNTPVRRKFLKSPQTEAGYISSVIERMASAHPEVAFKFIVNGQLKLHTTGNNNLKDIIYTVYGRDITRNVMEVKSETQNLKMDGYIAKPVVSRGNRNYEIYFINGRSIKSPVISRAIEDAYKSYTMQHRYPFVVLALSINPELIDVNVHPTKMEVRFTNSEELYSFIYNAIKDVLSGKNLIQQVNVGNENDQQKSNTNNTAHKQLQREHSPEPFELKRIEKMIQNTIPDSPIIVDNNTNTVNMETAKYGRVDTNQTLKTQDDFQDINQKQTYNQNEIIITKPVTRPTTVTTSSSIPFTNNDTSQDQESNDTYTSNSKLSDNVDASSTKPTDNADALNTKPTDNADALSAKASDNIDTPAVQQSLFDSDNFVKGNNIVNFKIIGQIFLTYWIVECNNNMYIIDQHAAHEKVLFEKTMEKVRNRIPNSQLISPPIIITLNMNQENILNQNIEVFKNLGYEIEPFGGNEYQVSAVPSDLPGIADTNLLIEIIDELSEDNKNYDSEIILNKVASLSCKAAIKGNNKISLLEANELITQLMNLENPFNCPHGRPTIISMTKYEIEKKFKRII